MMGLTGDDTQPTVSHQPRLVDNIAYSLWRVGDFSRKIQSNVECTPDQLRQTILSLAHLTDHANVLLRKHDTSFTAPSSTESITVTRYKCLECDGCDTDTKGIFTRHVDNMHHPKCMFLCPMKNCSVERPRRYQIIDHMIKSHDRKATKGELEAYKRDNACPAQCPLCHVNLNSWQDFDKCYRVHCSYEGPPNTRNASRRGSADQGNGGRGDESGNNQQVENTGMGNHAPAQPQSGLQGTTDRGIYHPSSSGAGGPTNQIARPQDLHRLPTDDRVTGNAGPIPFPDNVPRSSQITRRPTLGDDSHRINRQYRHGGPYHFTQDRRSRPPRGESDPGCTRCLHHFSSCQHPQCRRRTESSESCHACPQSFRIPAGIGRYPGPHLTDPTYNHQTIDPSLLARGYQLQPGTGQNIPEQFLSENRQLREQFQGWPFNNAMGWNFTDPQRSHRRNNPRALAVTSIEEPVFGEQEVALPSILDLKVTQYHGALLKMLPMMNPLKRWFSKPLKDLNSISLSGKHLHISIKRENKNQYTDKHRP